MKRARDSRGAFSGGPRWCRGRVRGPDGAGPSRRETDVLARSLCTNVDTSTGLYFMVEVGAVDFKIGLKIALTGGCMCLKSALA